VAVLVALARGVVDGLAFGVVTVAARTTPAWPAGTERAAVDFAGG
jgi:hypothetical protein